MELIRVASKLQQLRCSRRLPDLRPELQVIRMTNPVMSLDHEWRTGMERTLANTFKETRLEKKSKQ